MTEDTANRDLHQVYYLTVLISWLLSHPLMGGNIDTNLICIEIIIFVLCFTNFYFDKYCYDVQLLQQLSIEPHQKYHI